MTVTPLSAISPLDGRYASKVDSLRENFSEYGLIRWRLIVEVRWLIALAQSPALKDIPPMDLPTQKLLTDFIDQFDEQAAQRVKTIEQTTNHDVKAVEYTLQEFCRTHSALEKYIPAIHFACTSEDINNLSYALMLQEAREHSLRPTLETIHQKLIDFSKQYAEIPLLAHTHGQPASPTTLGKEFAVFANRLQRQLTSFNQVHILAKFNGAVGNFNAHQISYPEANWRSISREFIESFGLQMNEYTIQIEPHDWIAEYCHAVSRINTILSDLSRDIWGYISMDYFKQKKIAHEVGSSTMPHKVNPIDFENAEGNLGFANAMLDYFAHRLPLSRFQRDLTDSTLLRNLGVAHGHSVIAYQSLLKGLDKLLLNENVIQNDLEQNWSVLAEAIQTVMRRYGITDAYEQLKGFSRGQQLDAAACRKFIAQLAIPDNAKETLLQLAPSTYVGLASQLAQECPQIKD